MGALLYGATIRPRSLMYARDTDYSPDEPTQGMWMNFQMILLLQKLWDLALALEVVVWVLFASAVTMLLIAILP